jgi:hypothetical protein
MIRIAFPFLLWEYHSSKAHAGANLVEPNMTEQAIRALPEAPKELREERLRRVGEGIGKVVYASRHWVVKRERSPLETAALILIYRLVRKAEPYLPASWSSRLLEKPSRRVRLMRVMMQGAMLVAPKSIWWTGEVRDVWRQYQKRNVRGERLVEEHLEGTGLVPERITFPPVKVRVKGWPGWLTVSEATERVEATLFHRLAELAAAENWNEVDLWLERFLQLRQRGWSMGLFSVDPHLKNFGVTGERIVLLDAGGVTDRWADIEQRLDFEDVVRQPHIQLGLGPILGANPELAARFDRRWKSVVNRAVIRSHWPEDG